MRVLLVSDHTYPAGAGEGTGKRVSPQPSGSAQAIHDLLARGLADAGHRVTYCLLGGAAAPLPAGVELATGLHREVDIIHGITSLSSDWIARIEALGLPAVMTCHLDPAVRGCQRAPVGDHWIFVSHTLAQSFGKERFVHNGLDPAAYCYGEEGGDYLLFMSCLDWADEKGLDIALRAAAEAGMPLVVAGTSADPAIIQQIDGRCARAGATLVGDVRGRRKAELLAGAHALLFPTRVNEAFGLVMVEALLSGTPVICSDRGACREVVADEVGIVCQEPDDYVRAIRAVGALSRALCRRWAVARYHFHDMARRYAIEYERQLAAS